MDPGNASWEGSGVTVATIERELGRLWSAADSTWDGKGRRPDIRTSVLNLIVYARDEATARVASDAIDHLSGTHPSRAIILTIGSEDAASKLDASVSIQSHGAYAEFRQVCSELLQLRLDGPLSQHIDSVVIPLLAPDLPVFLWWPGEAPFSSPSFDQFTRNTDRLLLDSNDFASPEADLSYLATLVKESRHDCGMSDFNWLRLQPWQEAIAQFFDTSEFRPALDRLTELRLFTSRTGLTRPQAYLLAGWLASRLGLGSPKPEQTETGAAFTVSWGGRPVRILVADRPGPDGDRSAHFIQIISGEGTGVNAAEFMISANEHGQITTAIRAEGHDDQIHHRLISPVGQAELLFRSLEQFHHDKLFESALIGAGQFLRPASRNMAATGALL